MGGSNFGRRFALASVFGQTSDFLGKATGAVLFRQKAGGRMVAEAFVSAVIVRVMDKTLTALIEGKEMQINFARIGVSKSQLLTLKGESLEFRLKGSLLLGIELIPQP